MATKYQFDRLRERIVKHVEADWPQTLEEWDHLQEDIAQFKNDHPGAEDVHEHFPEPVSAIRLARECDIPSILRPAFYHLSTVPPSNHWDAQRSELDRDYWQRARWNLMQHEDFIDLLCCYQNIGSNSDFHNILEWFQSDDLCSETCRKAVKSATDPPWGGPSGSSARTNDPLLFATVHYSKNALELSGMCCNCIPRVVLCMQQSRDSIWEISFKTT
jgi:hypothetical protein